MGGVFYVLQKLRSSGLSALIDRLLGKRSGREAYQYSQAFEALCCSYLCGGECLEDTACTSRFAMSRPGVKMPSPDTIGRILKSLAQGNICYDARNGNSYEVNTIDRLNDLMVSALVETGQLKQGQAVGLDFDHQFIEAEKFDAKYSHKRAKGYFPGIASIGNLIVGVENRDGNDNVRFQQDATLGRILARLTYRHGIPIDRFRADCGSYSRDVIRCVDTFCKRFYIRASKCGDRLCQFESIPDWKEVEVNWVRCSVASVEAKGWNDNSGNALRLVVQRTEVDDKGQPGLFGKEYLYRCILTNDWQTSDLDIVLYYNARGASERNFDELNNDFGWSHLPFSFLSQNAVFLGIMAIAKNFYSFFMGTLSKIVPGLEPTSRIKKFIFRFAAVPAKWVRSGRRHILNLYTTRDFYQRAFET